MAVRLRLAVGDDSFPRALGVVRERQRHRVVDRRHAVEDCGDHSIGVLADEGLGDARSSGAAPQHHPAVSKGVEDLVDVLHVLGRGVVARVGELERPAVALPHPFPVPQRAEQQRRLGDDLFQAVHGVRLTRAALADEHQIPPRAGPRVELGGERDQRRRRLSGAAGEEQNRLGRLRGVGRQDHDPDPDPPALRLGPILRHLRPAAAGRLAELLGARLELQLGGRGRSGETRDDRGAQPNSRSHLPYLLVVRRTVRHRCSAVADATHISMGGGVRLGTDQLTGSTRGSASVGLGRRLITTKVTSSAGGPPPVHSSATAARRLTTSCDSRLPHEANSERTRG